MKPVTFNDMKELERIAAILREVHARQLAALGTTELPSWATIYTEWHTPKGSVYVTSDNHNDK